MQDLIANQIQVMVDQSSNSLPHVRAGKIRAYAVTAKERSPAAPDIPTAAEAGFPGIEVAIWHGLWAPKGTPPEIIAKLNAAAVAALKDPEIRRKPGGSRPGHPDARADAARRLRRLPEGRVRQMEADHREGEREGRVTAQSA